MAEIGFAEAVAGLRRELAQAIAEGEDAAVQFPVGPVTLQFQVGVTKGAEASAGLNFWVLELGSTGQYSAEAIHTVTVVLGPPVDVDGKPIKVSSGSDRKPG